MRKQLMAGVATAALVFSLPQAMAQAPGGGAGERAQPSASDKASGGMERSQQGGMNRSEQGMERSQKGQAQSQSHENRSDKSAQTPSTTKMGAERGEPSKQNAQSAPDSKMGTKDQKNMQRESGSKSDKDMKAQGKAEGTSDKDMNRNAQNPSATSPKMGSDTKSGTDTRMGTETKSGADSQSRVTTGSTASPTVTLNNEQRTEVREKVLASGPRLNNVNFSINVGTAIPHSVHVVTVPETLVRIHPEWRRHRYFVVNEQIIIIDDDWRIVAIVNV